MVRFKFEQWFPFYGGVLDLILAGDCQSQLCDPNANCSAQLAAYRATKNGATATVYDCLSAGLLPNEASNFQSAEVLLGLTPSLLTTLAPSIGEILLLSTRRRVLALLLAVANPSIYVSRLLSYNDPREYLKRGDTAFPDGLLILTGRNAVLVSLLQYTLAAGATVNVVHLSWELGFRTVIAWKCNASYFPFLWTIMPLFVHVIAAAGWHSSTPVRLVTHRHNQHSRNLSAMGETPAALHSRALSTSQTTRGSNKLAIFLNELAGFGAFLHLLFGTTVFSSLMFIGVLDALQVIARYIASGLICRLIVNWELAAMRAAEEANVAQGNNSSSIALTGVTSSGVSPRKTFP